MLTKAEISRLRNLHEKTHREAAGLFVVEGAKVIGELLQAGFPFLEIFATAEWPGCPAREGKVSRGSAKTGASPAVVIRITTTEMARISHFPAPSPVLAIGRITREPLPPGVLNRGLTLALDGIQDAGNVGTLLRIADWFAFDRVLLSPECADLFSQKVINASMGSFARLRVHTAPLAAAFAACAVPVLGCDLVGESAHALPPLADAVVVIGNEGHGLTAAVAACVTRRVTIPRHGGAESLNAAVAAGIVCDNVRRTQPRPG